MNRSIVWVALAVVGVAGCNRMPATSVPAGKVTATDAPVAKALPEVKALSVDPPYDTNWRQEVTGEAATPLRAKAEEAIRELKAAGMEVQAGDQTCRVKPVAKSGADGGVLQADNFRLMQLAGVTDLDLFNVPMTDAGLAQVSALRCLKRLSVYQGKVTADGLAALKPLRALEYVEFYRASSGSLTVTGEGFEHLAGCPKLTMVALRLVGATDAGLASLAKLPALTDLYLEGNQLTDVGLTHLRSLGHLQVLDLRDNPVLSGIGFKDLAGLMKLSKVMLDNCPITDAGAEALAGTRVKYLHLTKSRVTDVGVGTLAKSGTLGFLDLGRTGVTDAGLMPLAGLATLEFLSIRKTAVTDAGLETLATCPKLRELEVTTGPQLTPAGVERLKKAKPKLAVTAFES